ncbi:MAG: hypothetical protein A2046_04175 [Bacteroidetes bacterium GWA2_30_7]|nr:MAG: hypothetical protein A2046_04175 [Bacteroidetes bacterium GWA2_30_7]
MDEFFVFLIFLLVVLIAVFQLISFARIGSIKQEIKKLHQLIKAGALIQKPVEKVVERIVEKIVVVDDKKETPKVIPEEIKEIKTPIIKPPLTFIPQEFEEYKITEKKPEPVILEKTKEKKKGFFETFFEKNPDMEKFIGENLISKIGIVILVLGLGFFVKFAIDNNWINEYGRVAIGVLSGGILIGLAHFLRKSFAAFSSILVGGGIAVLYFTFGIAFHQYQLFSQAVTFVIMVFITIFAIIISLAYDRKELAVIAMLGGFGTPFFVSTGDGNYIVLFSYLLILNSGMLILSYFKNWYILNFIAFVFTGIIYGAWLFTKCPETLPYPPYKGALIFGTLFYLMFFVMNIINNVKEKQKFRFYEIFILLSNTFCFFSAGIFIFHNVLEGRLQGVFTVLLGVFNFIFAFVLFRNNKVDKNLIYFLIGLVLTFVSLAAPIQLNGNYITLFWAAEAVLLLWLGYKSEIKIISLASVVVVNLMIISLIMDWSMNYTRIYDLVKGEYVFNILPAFLNKVFITGIVVSASLFISGYLTIQNKEKYVFWGFKSANYKHILTGLFLLFFFLILFVEIRYQLVQNEVLRPVLYSVTGGLIFLYALSATIWASFPKPRKVYFEIFTGIIPILLFLYMIFYKHQFVNLRNAYLSGRYELTYIQFLSHYVSIIAICFLIFWFTKNVIHIFGQKSIFNRLNYWLVTFICIFIISAETDTMVVLNMIKENSEYHHILMQTKKIAYPIIWGISAFILMYFGMKNKMRDLRIISLSVILITLIKLFAYDIQGINEGGKIAAFISLGILLLIVSFMYQKLKKLLLDDENVLKTVDVTDFDDSKK